MSTRDNEGIAKVLHDYERRLESLERNRQLGNSSIEVDGESKAVVDVVRDTGLALSTADSAYDASQDAIIQVSEAVTSSQEAAAKADVAEATAGQAIIAANGKNRIYYQAETPTGTFNDNDLWFDTDQDNRPYRWLAADNQWVSEPFGNGAIGNIDAGKITAGVIAAGRIGANTIGADKLTVGAFSDNQVPNGGFEELNAAGTLPGRWTMITTDTSGAYQGQTFAFNDFTAAGTRALRCNIGVGGRSRIYHSDLLTCSAGSTLALQAKVAGTGTVRIGIYWYDGSNINIASSFSTIISVSSTAFSEQAFMAVVPANARTYKPTFEVFGTNGQWGAVDDFVVRRAVGSAQITDLAAGKITTGSLSAGTEIIAGDAAGTHARLTANGFYAYARDLVDGVPNKVISLGTVDDDYFGVSDSEGNLVATVDDMGRASFRGLSVLDDPIIGGRSFNGLLGQRHGGIVVRGWRSSNGVVHTAGNTAEGSWAEIQADVPGGRLYRVRFTGYGLTSSIVNSRALVRLRMAEYGTAVDQNSSVVVSRRFITAPIANVPIGMPDLEYHYGHLDTGFDGNYTTREVRFMITYAAETNNVAMVSNGIAFLMLEDIGPYDPDVQGNNNIDRTTPASGTEVTTTRKTYIKEFAASAAGSYRGDNTRRTDTTEVVQGQSPSGGSGNGIQKGYWVFPDLTATLAGSTVNKVEVYMYANHWYNNSGGTARIHLHGHSAIGSTYPAGFTHVATSTGWPKPGGRWVTLNSAYNDGFRTGAYKGTGMIGDSTDLIQYGRFAGAGTNGARLRITYTK